MAAEIHPANNLNKLFPRVKVATESYETATSVKLTGR